MAVVLASTVAHRRTEDNLTRAVLISFGLHIVVLVLSTFVISSAVRTAPPQAIQVRLVGVPQPVRPNVKPIEPEPIRTQDSAAPKEPPPDVKNIPDSTAKTKFVKEEKKPPTKEPPNPIEAKKRPPTLDKTPEKKKVVKNTKDAKVVKNPEDFLAALEFIDQLEEKNLTPAKEEPKTKADAGEGPQIQLNLSEQGEVDAIRRHIERFWLKPPGAITKNLETVVLVEVDPSGQLLDLQLIGRSGNDAYDNSILRAVRKAIPLPLPSTNTEKFTVLELHFQG